MNDHLHRLLHPRSVAVVGASEKRVMSNVAMANLRGAPIEVHLVNPNAPEAYGRATVATLRDIDGPVDAVMSLVGAERTLAVVEEAAAIGAGGIVVVASGFGELGAAGQAMEEELRDVAGDLAIVGPNCTGFANVTQGVSLFTGTAVDVRAGGISLVSSSGYLMRAAMVAARERNLGLRLTISAGNETVTTLSDYLDLFIDDPQTSVICAIVEKLRHPEEFFALAERARAAQKPLIVLKLGRTERARDIVRSHTGAITSDGWLFDVAFRSAGVIAADSIDDLLDLSGVLAQLPPEHHHLPAERIAVLTSSGGAAALISDSVSGDDVSLPRLDGLLEPLREIIPGATVANPLDLTGMAMGDPANIVAVLDLLVASDEVDAVVVTWWIGDDDADRARLFLEPIAKVAGRKPIIVATLEESGIGPWTHETDLPLVVFCRGLRGAARGLRAMRELARPIADRGVTDGAPIERPTGTVDTDAGTLASFEATMGLLTAAGVPVAPWWVFDPATWGTAAGKLEGATYVVKLGDVAHRSELGAVRLGVADDDVPAVAAELVELAGAAGVSPKVVVQLLVRGEGEAFIGTQNGTEVGDVIIVGLGGIFVELTRQVVGRRLPVAAEEVAEMLEEFGGDTVFRGLRGAAPWDRASIAAAVSAVAALSQRAGGWLRSMDINPLICTADGCTAVDALMILDD